MKVEVPLGDVVDRVTILEIKRARITDPERRANVERELTALVAAWRDEGQPPMSSLPEWTPLSSVNRTLWDVEDALRLAEAASCFDAAFVELARSVYRLNDERARLKRAISIRLGSGLLEEKEHPGIP